MVLDDFDETLGPSAGDVEMLDVSMVV